MIALGLNIIWIGQVNALICLSSKNINRLRRLVLVSKAVNDSVFDPVNFPCKLV